MEGRPASPHLDGATPWAVRSARLLLNQPGPHARCVAGFNSELPRPAEPRVARRAAHDLSRREALIHLKKRPTGLALPSRGRGRRRGKRRRVLQMQRRAAPRVTCLCRRATGERPRGFPRRVRSGAAQPLQTRGRLGDVGHGALLSNVQRSILYCVAAFRYGQATLGFGPVAPASSGALRGVPAEGVRRDPELGGRGRLSPPGPCLDAFQPPAIHS